MVESLLRTDKEKEITEVYERHVQMVYRICFSYMKNNADTEDVVSDTFYRLIKSGKTFESSEYEKAWLIRTASNLCKNALKHWWRKRENFESLENTATTAEYEKDEVFSAVMELPDKYKTIIYLYYYEGYNSVEISKMLKKPESTIRTYLSEARRILREGLGLTEAGKFKPVQQYKLGGGV